MRLLLEYEGAAKRVNYEGNAISLQDLKTIVTREFSIDVFKMQIHDALFNAFCDINQCDEVVDLSRIKIINENPEHPNRLNPATNIVDAGVVNPPPKTELNLRHDGQWKKENFSITTTDFCLVNRMELNEAEDLFKEKNKLHKASYKLKKEIMDILSNELCKFTVYPSETMYFDITDKLVNIYPFLKDPIGSANGGWKVALKFKMQEIRRKVTNNETSSNLGKRSKANPDKPGPHCAIKKAKRGEINYLPDFPKGETVESLIQHKTILMTEWSKVNYNKQVINDKMDTTFALRRKQIILEKTPLHQLQLEWPMLFTTTQLQKEMLRIVGVDIKQMIIKTLNNTALETVFRKKYPNEDTATPEALLKLIPQYFKDKWCFFLDVENPTGNPIPQDAIIVRSAEAQTWAIMAEGMLLVDGLDFVSAVSSLMAVYYAFNLQYPKKGEKSLSFIQQGLCDIEVGKCSQSVKNLIRDMTL